MPGGLEAVAVVAPRGLDDDDNGSEAKWSLLLGKPS